MNTELQPLIQFDRQNSEWDGLLTPPDLLTSDQLIPLKLEKHIDYRFFQVHEINKDNAEAQRLAMANVLSSISQTQARLAYLLRGTAQGVQLYIGVASSETGSHERIETLKRTLQGNYPGIRLQDIKRDDQTLENLFQSVSNIGLVTGIPSLNETNQSPENDFQGIERLANSLQGEEWQLLVIAEPGNTADIHAIIESLQALSTRASVAVKQTLQHSESRGEQQGTTTGSSTNKSTSKTAGTSETQSTGSNSSSTHGKSQNAGKSESDGQSWNDGKKSSNNSKTWGDSSSESKTRGSSKGTSSGTSTSDSISVSNSENRGDSHGTNSSQQATLGREQTNKKVEALIKHLDDSVIQRFQLGLNKGMFRTAVYVSAKRKDTYERLVQNVKSIFQGNQPGITPLQVNALCHQPESLPDLLQLGRYQVHGLNSDQLLPHSVPFEPRSDIATAATWMNTQDLALLTGVPGREIPGLKLRDSVDFAVNVPEPARDEPSLNLATLIHHGRELEHNPVRLPLSDLNKHTFVTGVTGAGKTTTCMRLLVDSNLPFLVIEPAKTEYRALLEQGLDVDYYQPGSEEFTPFRLNPFELVNSRVNLQGHIATLTSTLTAAYPMEAAMPQLVEEAIIKAYEHYGWDMRTNQNDYVDDDQLPWAEESAGQYWPTFSDMIGQLDELIESKKMGQEFTEKYRGSLVARLTNLTLGTKGSMLNSRRSLDFNALLDRKVVIELEELKSENDKALLMGLIVTRLAECMKHRHRNDHAFKHLTLIEEAHHLLTRPDGHMSETRRQGVEMFANLLAEVRKYGEGLIIADQVPNKLIPDVIKNTHTKIVHRLYAADDRASIGDAISLNDDQKDFLPRLQTGETIVFCGGWHAPVWTKIRQQAHTDAADVDEALMQQRGIQQQWQQRNRLHPYLCRTQHIQDQDTFATLTRKAPKAIKNLLGWLNQTNEESDIAKRQLQQYQAFVRHWQSRLELTDAQAGELVIALLLDSAHPPSMLTVAELTSEPYHTSVQALLNTIRSTAPGERLRTSDKTTKEIIDQVKQFTLI